MRTRGLLGMLSGSLIAFGISLILFLRFMHHIFIVATSSPVGIILHTTPVALVIAGVIIGFRALRR